MEYNQPPTQGRNNPMSPSTPSSATYKVNVNRQKTRKWVEAKTQNYDGDDWGASGSEGDEPDSPPPVPQPYPRPGANAARLPSATRVPGAGRPGHMISASTPSELSRGHGSQGSQPLSLQTQQPHVPTPLHERSAGGRESFAPIGGSSEQPSGGNTTSPQFGGATLHDAPSLNDATSQSAAKRDDDRDSWELDRDSLDGSPAERLDLKNESTSAEKKRLSVSPQLPNVARMSGFGPDLFGGSPDVARKLGSMAEEERESPQASSQDHLAASGSAQGADTSSSGPTVAPTTITPPAHSEGMTVDPEKRAGPSVSSTTESRDRNHLQAARSLPPLRTPSPHEPRTVGPPEPQPTSAASIISPEKPPTEITPTQPLQPKKPETSPSDYEPQPLNRQLTHDTTTSSPVKESDILSEEIMRSLSPVATGSSESPDDRRKSQATRNGRESSYTLSGYDDYWADTADKSGDDSKRKSSAFGLDNVPEVPPIPSTVSGGAAPGASSEPAPPAPVPASTMSPVATDTPTSALRRRFSWEAEEESRPAPTPPASALPVQVAPAPAPPVQAPPVQQTQHAAPPSVSPVSTMRMASPPPASTQQPANVAGDPSPQPSESEPASSTIKIVPPEPLTQPGTQPGADQHSPVSEHSNRDATPLAQPLELFPSGSPVPGQDAASSQGAGFGPPSASVTSPTTGKPIITFREIMNLSSPQERISKYDETRTFFASQDSGLLENWASNLMREHPEHARATGSYSGSEIVKNLPSSNAASGSGSGQTQPAQPHPNAHASHGGSARSRLAGFNSQAQAAAGQAFGQHGQQIGTKGKEFMHSAGKMGKGLFSKGKSKLRGDKVHH
jgi:serine/arginine repetitive matrix protein 2